MTSEVDIVADTFFGGDNTHPKCPQSPNTAKFEPLGSLSVASQPASPTPTVVQYRLHSPSRRNLSHEAQFCLPMGGSHCRCYGDDACELLDGDRCPRPRGPVMRGVDGPIHNMLEAKNDFKYCRAKDSLDIKEACQSQKLGYLMSCLVKVGLLPFHDPHKYLGTIASIAEKLEDIKALPHIDATSHHLWH
ncbi:hypothetical protein QBC43DRAFT_359666 [Cladorrhinum sp. PSN259]|nr:hypothetical protein QBC43DRAFT_359666 [Cladorrhinum sp. PSN259]